MQYLLDDYKYYFNSTTFWIVIPNPLVQLKSWNVRALFWNIPKIDYIKTSKLMGVGGEDGLNDTYVILETPTHAKPPPLPSCPEPGT